MRLLETLADLIDRAFERHHAALLTRLEIRMDAILAALQGLFAKMNTTVADLEAAIKAIPATGDPQPALDLIAQMGAALDAADATVKPAAPAPAEPPVPVDPPAPAAVEPAAPAAADPAV